MEYPKIKTLYVRDEKTYRLKPELVLTNRVYGIIKTWHFTEKIDGTNIRCIWDKGELAFGGRSDKSQVHPDLIRFLYETVTPEKMAMAFPAAAGNPPMNAIVYGEGYGAGIQKCGGDYAPTKGLLVFDVLVEGKWWMDWEAVCDVAGKLGLPTVPYIGEMTLEQATEMSRVGFPSALNGGKACAEGVVGRTIDTLYDADSSRLIVKLKTRDF